MNHLCEPLDANPFPKPIQIQCASERVRVGFNRHVSQKLYNSRHEAYVWNPRSDFPVDNRFIIDLQHAGKLILRETKINPALADMLANGLWLPGIAFSLGFGKGDRKLVKRQHIPASAGTTTTRQGIAPARRVQFSVT